MMKLVKIEILIKKWGDLMKKFNEYINFQTSPQAREGSMVIYDHMRVTVLTSRLLRVEYSEANEFRDVATKTFINRNLPTPSFEVKSDEDSFELLTEHLVLSYKKHKRGFTRDSFSIYVKDTDKKWCYGTGLSNLKGTCRTLDEIDGACDLGSGLISRDGIAVIDDTASFTFDDTGWFNETYFEAGTYEDFYIFGYGHDYKGCLAEYMKVAGKVPMLPRWALGNWWSRYWKYTEEELLGVMDRFQEEEIPLSVCIIDMDWHITDVSGGGSGGWHAGWTGYTWNTGLFPDPKAFLDNLHSRGIKTSLNLHPADGLMPHEEMYEEMAGFMGMDPSEKEQIPFDIVDKRFAEGYFDIMHRPHEDNGVDFWWMDWQQGLKSKSSHLDPLFLLNHLHYLDRGRDENKRGFVFSRWGGLGNHRYPIGFSGDAHGTWDSLAFQPHLTSTAANVGYGWWSHDIGGHKSSRMDQELFARWVQYGVFSPILRLHSTNCTYENRHPWAYTKEILDVTKEAMQLRHQLIPYLYTMSWLNYEKDIPFILPLYYNHPEREEAYLQDSMYYFGEQLIAAPYVKQADEEVGLSHQDIWLPEGDWYDFFSGDYYEGDSHYPLYGTLNEIPVFAKEGSIIPLAPQQGKSGVEIPINMELHIFPGREGSFTLFEDNGESQGYMKNKGAKTTITQKVEGCTSSIKIQGVEGNKEFIPEGRSYELRLKGFANPEKVIYTSDSEKRELPFEYDEKRKTIFVEPVLADIHGDMLIDIVCKDELARKERDPKKVIDQLLRVAKVDSRLKEIIIQNKERVQTEPYFLLKSDKRHRVTDKFMKAIIEIVRDKPIFMLR